MVSVVAKMVVVGDIRAYHALHSDSQRTRNSHVGESGEMAGANVGAD